VLKAVLLFVAYVLVTGSVLAFLGLVLSALAVFAFSWRKTNETLEDLFR